MVTHSPSCSSYVDKAFQARNTKTRKGWQKMTTNKQAKLTPHVHARLSTYATLAGAARAVPMLANQAGAAIVYSGPTSINIPSTTAGVYLNVVTGVSAVTPAGAPGYDLNPWGSGSLFLYGNGTGFGSLLNYTGGSSATLADNLPFGATISGAFTFGNAGVETTGATAFTLNSSANYVGFRFTNESTGAANYGWAQLSLSTTSNAQPRSIVGYAYENTGAAILAGQTAVPEPTTTALLGAMATGAVGLRQWRRRKAA